MATISLCMITKNEEKNLEKCLTSVKPIVDEIIIIDTGSTDKTKEIAKKFTDKVYDFKWNNDFSEARNFSLSKSTKDWILVLDADEVIANNDIDKIKKLTENKEIMGYSFIRRNYTNNSSLSGWLPNDNLYVEGKNFAGLYLSKLIKLFWNKKEIRFEGIIHELVDKSIEKLNGKIKLADIPLHHFSSLNLESEKEKRKFYLKICQEKTKQEPNNGNAFLELGIICKELEMHDEAINAFEKATAINKKLTRACLELGIVFEKKEDYNEAIKHYRQALKINPKSSEALFGLGICFFRLGILTNAKENFEKALELNPNNPKIYTSLGAVYEKLGDNENAIKILEFVIKFNPKNSMAYFNLGIVFEKEGKNKKAIEAYENAIRAGHKKSLQLKNKINELKSNLSSINYSYSVGFKN